MPPHVPSFEKGCSGDRQRHEVGLGRELLRGPGQRSASFHGRGAEQRHQLPKQRPKTQPDLLAGMRGRSFRVAEGVPEPAAARKTPSKVLVSVAVLRSMWPLHVMAPAEWSVADLVAAAVGLYVKEGRRPLLPSADPAGFGLHYSQFCLESLDPREKVMALGSRSFFLCPRSSSESAIAASSSCSSAGASRAGDDNHAPTAAGEHCSKAAIAHLRPFLGVVWHVESFRG